MELWRAWTLKMEVLEAQNRALEGPVCAPMVANSNHFYKEQDPDSDPH
jgi:hypothetical protein